RPSSGIRAVWAIRVESGLQAGSSAPRGCSVILHGSPPSAGNTWICGRSSSSGRRKAIHRPSGEWTAPLSRSPRVNLTGWSEPLVGTDQRELEQASLSRSGRASTNTTRFPSGDSVGALMLCRWLMSVGFIHGRPQGAGRPEASSLSLGSDPSGGRLVSDTGGLLSGPARNRRAVRTQPGHPRSWVRGIFPFRGPYRRPYREIHALFRLVHRRPPGVRRPSARPPTGLGRQTLGSGDHR